MVQGLSRLGRFLFSVLRPDLQLRLVGCRKWMKWNPYKGGNQIYVGTIVSGRGVSWRAYLASRGNERRGTL